ncbi:MAG: 3'-5' exonuclease, partial [Prochlorococcaceae cyanobacterium]
MAQPTRRWQQTSLLSLVPAAAEAGLAEPAKATSSAQACPQHLLILDTETTGLDPERDQCIEVGAVLFHVPSRAVLSQLSLLLPCHSNPAKAINGIDAAVSRLEQPWQAGLIYFQELVA